MLHLDDQQEDGVIGRGKRIRVQLYKSPLSRQTMNHRFTDLYPKTRPKTRGANMKTPGFTKNILKTFEAQMKYTKNQKK
jgi:hypothetical protein